MSQQDDALALLKWNRTNYPQSLDAHIALIKAYLHFKMPEDAKAALKDALKTLNELAPEQKAQLEALFA